MDEPEHSISQFDSHRSDTHGQPVTGGPSENEPGTSGDDDLNDLVHETAASEASLVRLQTRAAQRARGANGRFIRVAPELGTDDDTGDLPDDRFLDREISWLQFNERVRSWQATR